ncbi:hypothetical protein CRUP_033037 [Coryphaenoides rupestris]|nr:hypothetical protein CRUP_033037 [Coryphaenoides rupestris]
MRRACKCHGVSGSCSIQTCWMQLPDFRSVGNYLKVKHEQAQKLEMDKRRMRAGNSADNRGAFPDAFSGIPHTELIYLEDSPNYCAKNRTLGLRGTEGRECVQGGDKNTTQWERRSCRRLCHDCGLRVVEKSVQIVSSCNSTRETSFVHAIGAAGVMYTLTRNCSLGDLGNCGCDVSKNGKIGGRGWLWGGCSDNVDFGERISKLYVDAQEAGQDSRAAVNLHNNEAGRMAVKATMKRICRCHGMSESCSVKTCWTQLSDFRDIGDYLKTKHEQAQKLELDKKLVRSSANNADNRGAIADAFGDIAPTELIYLEDSPDYCRRNVTLGLHGTEGRECLMQQARGDLSAWERRSCRRLCHDCGLRVEERRVEVASSCNCTFRWCCKVDCEDCSQVIVKHVCAKREAAHAHGGYRKRHRGAPK